VASAGWVRKEFRIEAVMFLREFERGGEVLCYLLDLYPQSSMVIHTRHEANP
jgi:hypothetical protein